MAKKIAKQRKPPRWGIIVLVLLVIWILFNMTHRAASSGLTLSSLFGDAMILSFVSFVFLAYLQQAGIGGMTWSRRLRIGYVAALTLACLLAIPYSILGLSET